MRKRVEELLGKPSTLDLPAWRVGWDEKKYNAHVQDVRPGRYLCLDRRGVRTSLHAGNGIEICDLLGPDNELIHVKRARGSSPLSHLFNQALVSAQTLAFSDEARAGFVARVREIDQRRRLREDFTPPKVVFAILLKTETG